MIERAAPAECDRFQRAAWDWLSSGEITRTRHMLSPLEELAGFGYGFIYLLEVRADGASQADAYKIGFSEHPGRRIRELQPQYKGRLRLRACFVGDPPAERTAHRRFVSLRIKNELFLPHPVIEAYFHSARERLRAQLRALHVCSPACPPLNRRLDLAMLSTWLAR